MKSIMYHYICPFNKELPYFKNLHIEDFSAQLDFFEKEYGFVSKVEFINSFKTGILPKGVILTFDDGLKCHYDYAFKELKKRKLWGIFYISTQSYGTNKMIDVHRIHLLLGKCSGKVVYKELMKIITDVMLSDEVRNEFIQLTYIDQENDDYTLLVKRILNYYISYQYREKVLDALMQNLIPKKIDNVSDFYLNFDEIKEMNDAGMIIGSHTVSHSIMSKLSMMEQRKEIKNSFELLHAGINKLTVKTFCYPYGGFHTFTNETEKILTEENCLFSFNVEHRDVTIKDIQNRPQALPRYDCNYFPYGKCRENNK